MIRLHARAEWLRLSGRRDLRILLLAGPLVVGFKYLTSLISLNNSNPTGIQLPDEALRELRFLLMRYDWPQVSATALSDAMPELLVVVGVLASLSLGNEFQHGTVRAGVVHARSRPSYLAARLAGAFTIVAFAELLWLGVTLLLPSVARLLDLELAAAPPLEPYGIALFTLAYSAVIMLAVSITFALTVMLKSPVLALGAFVALAFVDAAVRSLAAPVGAEWVLPGKAAVDFLHHASQAAGVLDAQSVGDLRPRGTPAQSLAALMAWASCAILLAFAIFRRRDIRE